MRQESGRLQRCGEGNKRADLSALEELL